MYSETTTYAVGVPWKILVKRVKQPNNKRSLGFYLCCNKDDESEWSCFANARKYRIMSVKTGVDIKEQELGKHEYNNKQHTRGPSFFMDWDEAVNPDTGYITSDNKMTFQVLFSADPVKRCHS